MASGRTARSVTATLKAVLDGEIQDVRMVPGGHGVMALRLRLSELREASRSAAVEGLSSHQASGVLRISPTAVKILINKGIIGSVTGQHPHSRQAIAYVTLEEIDRFQATYVNAVLLARTVKMTMKQLRANLETVAVKPAYSRDEVGVTLYRLSDLERFFLLHPAK